MPNSEQGVRAHVRDRYAAAALAVRSGSPSGSAASCCGPSVGAQRSCCGPSEALGAITETDEGDIFGAALYRPGETDGLPEEAVLASLGCGNPLAVDVVISNCVINLSTDKPAVLAEMYRVLTSGGRLGISDVVAEDGLSVLERAERGTYVGCVAGALSRSEYLHGLSAAGFVDPEVIFTHEVAPEMHGAIVRAVKPIGARAGDPT